jgi:hypothetical protein
MTHFYLAHFYLALPSSSSQQFFPDNTTAEFTTKLSSTIELLNEWEVVLAQIMFPGSWYTIPKRGLQIEVDCSRCEGTPLFQHDEERLYYT